MGQSVIFFGNIFSQLFYILSKEALVLMLHIVREHCVDTVRGLWKELEFTEFNKRELLEYLNNPEIQDSLGLMRCCRKLLKSQDMHHNCGENPCEEDIEKLKQELLAKARKRKDAARERSEKKVKNVSITGDREAPYDLEKVLKALGEPLTDTSKNSGKKSKDASGGGKKKRKNSKKEILIVVSSPTSSDTGEKDSDDVSSHSSRASSRTESMVSSSKSSTNSSGMGSRDSSRTASIVGSPKSSSRTSSHSRASSRTESIIGSPKYSTDSRTSSRAESIPGSPKSFTDSGPKKPQIKDSVNIPNYDQIIQLNQRLWNELEVESKQGLVYYF